MLPATNAVPHKTLATNLAKVKGGTKERKGIYVLGWPRDKAIPEEYSDWLAYLLIHGILDAINYKLEDSDVVSVRYNLTALQAKRSIEPLFPSYPQMIVIQKVGPSKNGSFNIWIDDQLSCMIRNGIAYGEKVYSKAYDRCSYTISRLLATIDEDLQSALNRFPHAKRFYYWFEGIESK